MQKELQSETTNSLVSENEFLLSKDCDDRIKENVKRTGSWMIIDITDLKDIIYWNNFSYNAAVDFVNSILKDKKTILIDNDNCHKVNIAIPLENAKEFNLKVTE